MRVTQNTSSNLVLQNLQVIQQRQDVLEQESSTGYRVSAIGDDPAAAQQIVRLNTQTAATNQYARNINAATSLLTMANSSMSSMQDVLTSVKQLAVQMSSGTYNAQDQAAAVQQLTQLKNQLISLGNTQLNGTYLFGGFKNDTPPFDTTGAFTGTADSTNIEIAPGTSVSATYSGSQLLAGGGGGVNAMAMMDNLISAVGSGDQTQIGAQLSNIDQVTSQVTSAEALVGSSMNRLTTATSVGQDSNLATSQVVSTLQDADYLQVVSDLAKQQTAYQAAIAASAKVSQVSLLDYLS